MNMHRSGQTNDHSDPYLRLRYSTQFTIGGRAHTIEMEIPVPLGASAEQREQLMREAEASIEQLYRQLEKRGSGRAGQPAEANRSQEAANRNRTGYSPAPQPAQVEVRPTASDAPTRQPSQPAPPPQVATQAPTRDTSQVISLQGKREAAETTAPSSSRASIGSEMPSTHNLNDSTSGAIKLSEFIRIIRDRWSISPKDVIDLLQVPNLNNMNYRELLRQLEPLVEQRAKAAPKNAAAQPRPATAPPPVSSSPRPPASPSSTTMRDASARPPSSPPLPTPKPPANTPNRAPTPPSAPPPSKPAPAASPGLDGPANIPVFPLPGNRLREVPRPYKFDEEDEEGEEAQGGNHTNEDENAMPDALARIKMDELKEIRGNATASPGRLTVLHNLLDSQISDSQFQQLIEGLWNINSDKKLKQDHVEVLISWAKEDYFEDEVRAVLAVMNG